MSKLQRNLWFGIAVLFAVGLVVYFLSYFVISPGHIIPELGGDGAKNNFTYLYQCMYGKGYWFDGMNYPYGEHTVYTDGVPLLTYIITSFGNVSAEQALTVLWLLMGLSYVLAILFLYKTLTYFKLPPFIAILFAGLIAIFTPQVIRLQGHYAMSFTCVVPMLFYWTIKYNEQFRWRYCAYFFALGCIMVFIHPYFAALMLVWAVFYALGYIVFNKGRLLAKVKQVLPLVVCAFMVFGLVALVLKTTDPVKDRPTTPFSTFYENCTRPKQIITSIHSPLWAFALKEKSTKRLISDGGEGYTYLGMVVAITMIICFVVGVMRSFRQKKADILIGASGFSPIWVFMAAAALLFSMGVPFIWHLEWLLGYMSFFKQFRSLGRFSWIFYYIIMVYCVIAIYTFYAAQIAKRKFVVGYAVLILSIGFWSYEASGYVKYVHDLSLTSLYNYRLIFSKEEQTWPVYLEEHHYKSSDFQAEILLPFFHIGTEKIWLGNPDWIIMLGSKAAMQLHLPVVDVMMSRSSWSEAQKQVETAGGPYVAKPLLNDIKSNKPFLLLQFDIDSLNPDQKYLLEAADYIGHRSQCYVYACYPDRIRANDKRNADSINRILPLMQQRDTVISKNSGTYYYDHFDNNTAGEHLFGTGGLPGSRPDDSFVIATVPVVPVSDSQLYEFSCWFLLGNKDYRSPFVTLEELDSRDTMIRHPDALTKQSTESEGMWFRSSVFFYIQPGCKNIRLKLHNDPAPTYFAMDEMLLRPAGVLVISKDASGKVMVNNHFFKK